MKTFSPLDLIGAHAWRRATFTTYAFSAAFTEAVLVEALLRQGVTEITILTDPLGYRMALRERGAVRIGREYVVHPVAMRSGCFHPKLMVLEADDATHVTVGSNNLTFGGWSANLECIEHLHDDGMSTAIGDVGRFFAMLADASTCDHDARDFCRALGLRLAGVAATGRDDGTMRVASSLEGPILERIRAVAGDLGGARTLTMASPYWEAAMIERLAASLGVGEVRAHVPATRVPAPIGMDWPRASKVVRAVKVEHLSSDEGRGRGLHAKLAEVACTRGRLVVSGSANATSAALAFGGEGIRNVEVCVLRTDPRASRTWQFKPDKAPPKPTSFLDGDEAETSLGVLVAAHGEDGIHGRMLTPWIDGPAMASMEVGRRLIPIGTVMVSQRVFVLPLSDVGEEDLSLEGRVQLRLEAAGKVAEGFVTAPNFGAIRGRAGKALPSMLAIIKNVETPEDVLAVMEFVRANPEALRTRVSFRSRNEDRAGERPDPLVDPHLVGQPIATDRTDQGKPGSAGKDELAWRNFVSRLLQAFAKKPVQAEDDEDDESDRTERLRRVRSAQATEKLGLRFPELFYRLADAIESDVELVNLARMTNYVCLVTDHPSTSAFVARLVSKAKGLTLGTPARDTLSWCLGYMAAGGADSDAASIRGRMLALGVDPARTPEEEFALPGFAAMMAPGADIAMVQEQIRATRTVHDDVRALEAGLAANEVPEGLSILAEHPSWRKLMEHCAREPSRRRIHFVDRPVSACQHCRIVRPHLEHDLRRHGISDTGCHGFILLRQA